MLRGPAFSEQNFCFSHGSKHYLGMEDSLMFRHVHKCYVGETTLQHLTWYMKIKWSRCRNNYLKSKCNVLKESQIPSFLPWWSIGPFCLDDALVPFASMKHWLMSFQLSSCVKVFSTETELNIYLFDKYCTLKMIQIMWTDIGGTLNEWFSVIDFTHDFWGYLCFSKTLCHQTKHK